MVLHHRFAIALLAAVVLSAANAATFTWDGGAANDSWDTSFNWVGDVAPSALTDDVIIPSGSQGGPIIVSGYQINSVMSETSLRIWQNGRLDVSSSSSSSNFGQYYDGVLSGMGDFTMTGNSVIHSNSMNGRYVPLQTGMGRTINNGSLDIEYGLRLDGNRNLVNNGTLYLQNTIDLNGGDSANALAGGGQITNNGLFNFATSTIAPSFIKVGNPDETGLSPLVHNTSTGSMNHLGTGRTTVDASLVNDGMLHVGALSAFTFNGSFTQGADAVFDLNIDRANTLWDSAHRSFANITLDGTLRLDATGVYVPKAGDSYTLFSATQHQGNFKNVTGGTGFDGLRLHSSWSDGSFLVTAVPEPESYALMLAGLGLMGAFIRRRR